MEEITDRIVVVPDPRLIIDTLVRPCMIWLDTIIGSALIIGGVLWLLARLGLLPSMALGPVMLVILGLLCFAEIRLFWQRL